MKRIGAPKGYRLATSVTVDPGGSWGARLARGDVVRFIDLEGQQAVDFLCYNASDTRQLYFGFGERCDYSVEIRWPDGTVKKLAGSTIGIDTHATIAY